MIWLLRQPRCKGRQLVWALRVTWQMWVCVSLSLHLSSSKHMDCFTRGACWNLPPVTMVVSNLVNLSAGLIGTSDSAIKILFTLYAGKDPFEYLVCSCVAFDSRFLVCMYYHSSQPTPAICFWLNVPCSFVYVHVNNVKSHLKSLGMCLWKLLRSSFFPIEYRQECWNIFAKRDYDSFCLVENALRASMVK